MKQIDSSLGATALNVTEMEPGVYSGVYDAAAFATAFNVAYSEPSSGSEVIPFLVEIVEAKPETGLSNQTYPAIRRYRITTAFGIYEGVYAYSDGAGGISAAEWTLLTNWRTT